MKLSKAQRDYIDDRRTAMEQREKDIRSIGDDVYKSTKLSAELLAISQEHMFFNHMIRLHNVEMRAEKAEIDFRPIPPIC
jgi:hypothetical protein